MLRHTLDLAFVMASPGEVLARPEVQKRAPELGGNWRNEPLPGPNREELLAIVSEGESCVFRSMGCRSTSK
jgi:hypothetical protein